MTVVCKTVLASCNDPGSIQNSKRILFGLDHSELVQYTCNQGYEISTEEGSNTVVMECLETDRWNTSLPSCQRVLCGDPGDRDHSAHTQGSHYQDLVTYSCQPGYRMPDWSNSLKTTCTADKTWDPQPVDCIMIECVKPQNIPFADRIAPLTGPYRLGDKVNYKCWFGYRPKVPAHVELTCDERGLWSGTWPECLKIRCGDPGMVANASRIVTGNGAGTVLIYSCNHGFYHDPHSGPLNRTCQENSSWTGSGQPRCLGMYCGEPPEVTDATFTPANPTYRFPETIRYTCNLGYKANYTVGIDQITCTWRGVWDFPPFSCQRVRCVETNTSENTEINNEYYYYQDVKTMYCLSGYSLPDGSVQKSRTCEASRHFSDAPPKCQKVRCPDPWTMNFSHVNITGPGNEYRDLLTFTCDPGYEIQGQNLAFMTSVICQADRTWSSPLPVCTRVSCGEPDLHLNVKLESYPGHLYGDTVEYRCHTGYVFLKGDHNSTCEANRRWTGQPFYCIEKDCGEPASLQDGEKIGSNFRYGGRVSFRCNTGFELVGAQTMQCEASGDWSEQIPQCQRLTCSDPDDLPHADFTPDTPGQNFEYGDSVTYICHYGYRWSSNSGSLQRSCDATSRWSGKRPVCEPVDCGDPGDIEGTYKLGMKFTYGQVVNYTCSTGYETDTGTTWTVVRCQADGTWTGQWPTCQKIICGDPGPGGNATREVSSNQFDYGSTVRYHCKAGYYYPDGHYLLRCLDTKSWSVPVPHCISVPKFESVKEPEKVPQEPAEADDAQTYGYIGLALIGLEVFGVIVLDLATIQKDINLLRRNLNMKVHKAKKKVKEIKENIKIDFSNMAKLKTKAMVGFYGGKKSTVFVAPAVSDDVVNSPPPPYWFHKGMQPGKESMVNNSENKPSKNMLQKGHMKLRSVVALQKMGQLKQQKPDKGAERSSKPTYYATSPPKPVNPPKQPVSLKVHQVLGAMNPAYLEQKKPVNLEEIPVEEPPVYLEEGGQPEVRSRRNRKWIQRGSESRGSETGSDVSGKMLVNHE